MQFIVVCIYHLEQIRYRQKRKVKQIGNKTNGLAGWVALGKKKHF